ncbi:hypothetical protein M0R89_18760 (plasmid) [Halorussus limi]|uniref:Uncharacterized protein n=1 Tax=Halorussus limi TaxID=2938695 RepID=A0A8U0HZN6_9EURY|nr:hypothetical protein [Halorussus limi]UPV76575.1 hypothetical protein M0R89_18760 [Halorussus limi]
MSTIRLPTDLSDRYELLADELDGFDDADELAEYVLESTATEIERGDAADARTDRADDDVVEDRLEQLGYLEK